MNFIELTIFWKGGMIGKRKGGDGSAGIIFAFTVHHPGGKF